MSAAGFRSGFYRGRLAPSPTGYLHLGHARTFWIAWHRARERNGRVVLRNDDLDRARCRSKFVQAMLEDLRWLGLDWDEGPDCGGPHAPYDQSARTEFYRAALERLIAAGWLYPCTCSRKDIRLAASAPHPAEDEPVYPGTCRERRRPPHDRPFAWRFRVPDGRVVRFYDGRCGFCSYEAGREFGDFVVWRSDDTPAYHLACVVDDASMGITEVVRGEDLLRSTARQLLLYEALGWTPPAWFHCALVTDEHGRRLAKRHDALSLRALREQGADPVAWTKSWGQGGIGPSGAFGPGGHGLMGGGKAADSKPA